MDGTRELALQDGKKKPLQNYAMILCFPHENETLTQHDGIHCTTRTELNQNLQRKSTTVEQ